MDFTGIHHLTAISSRPRDNLMFYTQVLGLRLVKKTVNQDAVSAYHLFYADGLARPGTDLTFFDFPVPPERRGTNSISNTALRISGAESFDYWHARLKDAGLSVDEPRLIDGRMTLHFEDGEGQRLSLIDDGGEGTSAPWERSPVPAQYQIRGLGPISLTVADLSRLEPVLLDVMNMRRARTFDDPHSGGTVVVYEMGPGGAGAELHVSERKDLPVAQQGSGAVHHVAFRSPDADYDAWASRLKELRIANSGKVDRFYFRSLYFREPNGILFEIATDGPGFASDEPMESLGERLSLPPFLEDRRAEIEAGLKPLD